MVDFENGVKAELGVVAGQPWTLQDDWSRTHWGKFKGISRTYLQDVAVYELLRSGDAPGALNQLIQNMKAKKQAVIDDGNWESAWLLTGLPDRLDHKRFAGTPEEMTAIAAYRKARLELNKVSWKKPDTEPNVSEDEEKPPKKPKKPKGDGKGTGKEDKDGKCGGVKPP